MQVKQYDIDDINLGDTASFSKTWNEKDLELFAALSENINPLHIDEEYARTTIFGARIMYGMHVAVLSSTLVGVYLPGKRCLCLKQDLQFKKPIYVGDTVLTTGTITKKSKSTRIITVSIIITKGNEEIVTGDMTVKLL